MNKKVLFVCIHNSARSQMAEAFLNQECSPQITAQSAGLEPGQLNPLVVEVMSEVGIDISKNQTKSVARFFESGEPLLGDHRLRRNQRGTVSGLSREGPAVALGLSRPVELFGHSGGTAGENPPSQGHDS